MSTAPPSIFTVSSVVALTAVSAVGVVAFFASKVFLSQKAKPFDRFTFIWLSFDALVHIVFEGSWVYLSSFGGQVNTSDGLLADMWKDYARADFRWGWSDPTVLSLELLTVFGAAPMCLYIMTQIIRDDPTRHYWLIVLSVAELYGGWMTFCPEWLTGNHNLDTSNFLFFWIYLVFMNTLWVFIPLWLMVDSYRAIAHSLRAVQVTAQSKRA